MNNKLLFGIAIMLISSIISCKKENHTPPAPLPVANFSVSGYTSDSVIVMATYDQYPIENNSLNGASYLWKFGNDSTSSLENPILSYPKSGSYVVTLIVQNKDGKKAIITKNVKVLDRVLKQVVITHFFPMFPATQSLNHTNVWTQIRYAANDSAYTIPLTTNASFNAPVIYKSQTISSFDSTSSIPYTLNVSDKIILDYPSLLASNLKMRSDEYKHIGYGLELYAQNSTGTYLVESSYQSLYIAQSGFGMQILKSDIQHNIFIAGYLDVELICDYE